MGFKNLTEKVKTKDYSIAELLGSGTSKTANTQKASSGITGTFTPSKTVASGTKSSIADILAGVDEKVGSVASNLPGITTAGAAIKSHYNSKGYAEDKAAADSQLKSLEASKPGDFAESDALSAERNNLSQIEKQWAEKYPDGYQGKYDDKISELIDRLSQNEKFSYDFATDPVFNSIKDQYQRNAMLGMREAMGAAAGLTGGYGNSNAQMAGQQAYQQSISEMTDIIPELADSSLARWQANRGALTDNLYAVMSADQQDFSKYQAEYEQWATDRDYFANKIANMRDDEFEEYYAKLQAWQADRAFYSGEKQQAIANQQFEQQLSEERRQFNNQMLYNYINMGVGAGVDLLGIGVDAALSGANLLEDKRQFDASLAQEQAQFDANLAHEDKWNQADYDLALKEFIEDQRQFNANLGYDYASLAQNQNQFDANLAEEQRQFNFENDIVIEDTEETDDEEQLKALNLYLKNSDHYDDPQKYRETAIAEAYEKGYITENTARELIKKWLK